MVRYFYAWTPLAIVGAVVLLALPWLGLIALVVVALVALPALAFATVVVPYLVLQAIARHFHHSSVTPRRAAVLSAATRQPTLGKGYVA